MSFARKAGLRLILLPVVMAGAAGITACIIRTPVAQQLDVKSLPVRVESSVKAHLLDGSTIVYPNGVSLANNTLVGPGLRYAIGLNVPTSVVRVALDSVVGMENYGTKVSEGASVALTLLAIPLVAAASMGAAVVIFGSCPTFYADSAGTELLQAEGFSYAIAPLFEQRDVDRLRLTPTPDGRVVLRIRNEALETHYINQLELLEVTHRPGESALPDQGGHPLAVGDGRISATIRDRSGRDISASVSAIDQKVFTTLPKRLASATANDLDDHIDVAFKAPTGADSVVVMLYMRNSLLNTVLLYDHILAAPGIKSLDFLGKEINRIAGAVDLGRWYAANMGMRVSVRDGNSYRPIARLGDSGPIAFHRIGVVVPAVRSNDDSVRVRLSFVADNWRIDEIGVAASWRRPSTRTVTLSRIQTEDPKQVEGAARALGEPDEDYLITMPGQAFTAEFDVGSVESSSKRTWFSVSQGYYTEWVRGSWIKNATGKPFTPSNESLLAAVRGWQSKQNSMETQFYNHRISAR
jgi:hypothetical protein